MPRRATLFGLLSLLSGPPGEAEANTVALGRAVAVLGTAAALRAAAPPASTLYAATLGFHRIGDGGEGLYRRGPTSQGHVGDLRSADGAIWVLEPQNETLNVKQFGARGDGETDDTATLLAATEALRAMPASTLRFPPGRYVVSGPILRLRAGDRRLAFIGADAETTHIVYGGPSEAPLIDIEGGTGRDRVEWVSFREITFRNINRRHPGPCARVANAYHVDWVRCRWIDVAGYALRLDNYWDSNFEGCRIIGCGSADQPAVWIGSTDERDWSNNLNFMACQFEASRHTQVMVEERSRRINFIACKFHGPQGLTVTQSQLLIRGSNAGKIIGCAFAYGQEHDLVEFIADASGAVPRGWVVMGNDFSYAGGAALRLRAGDAMAVLGNVFGTITRNTESIGVGEAVSGLVFEANAFARNEPAPDLKRRDTPEDG